MHRRPRPRTRPRRAHYRLTRRTRARRLTRLSRRRAWIVVPCAACGAPLRRLDTRGRTAAFCSSRCRATYYSGQHHPLSRTGPSAPYPASWARLAEQIRRRDGYTCSWCGTPQAQNGRRLSVDHIIPRRAFASPAEADTPLNLVSLCQRCHGRKTAVTETKWLRGDALDLALYAALMRPRHRIPLV